MQSKAEGEYLKASLKFLFIVIAMIYLYPVIGVETYGPITSLLEAGSLPSLILMMNGIGKNLKCSMMR